jgi:hypothetical protein
MFTMHQSQHGICNNKCFNLSSFTQKMVWVFQTYAAQYWHMGEHHGISKKYSLHIKMK